MLAMLDFQHVGSISGRSVRIRHHVRPATLGSCYLYERHVSISKRMMDRLRLVGLCLNGLGSWSQAVLKAGLAEWKRMMLCPLGGKGEQRGKWRCEPCMPLRRER